MKQQHRIPVCLYQLEEPLDLLSNYIFVNLYFKELVVHGVRNTIDHCPKWLIGGGGGDFDDDDGNFIIWSNVLIGNFIRRFSYALMIRVHHRTAWVHFMSQSPDKRKLEYLQTRKTHKTPYKTTLPVFSSTIYKLMANYRRLHTWRTGQHRRME